MVQSPSTHPTPHASYDPVFFKSLFAIEDKHFWFGARNQVVAAIGQQIVAGLTPGYHVLEVGCGTGNTLRVLEQVCTQGVVVGMDLFGEGLHFARQRVTCPLVQGDMQQPPFNAHFDLIGMFDVLEHLADDIQVLCDLYTLLSPDGTLFLTVPAHPSLWSYFDEAACHHRRYLSPELTAKLIQAGYQVVYQSEYMASIFPLVWIGRRVAALTQRQRSATDIHQLAQNELRIVPIVNDVLARLLIQEARLIAKGYTLPFGASLLVVARKAAMH